MMQDTEDILVLLAFSFKKKLYLHGRKEHALCCSPTVLGREKIKSVLISS